MIDERGRVFIILAFIAAVLPGKPEKPVIREGLKRHCKALQEIIAINKSLFIMIQLLLCIFFLTVGVSQKL